MGKNYHPSWEELFKNQFDQPYMKALSAFVQSERELHVVYPPAHQVFNAFALTPFSSIKVVVLGQDPYHNEGQAHGLSFSVPDGVQIPPSLRNIYAELSTDILGFQTPKSGNLIRWAEQGVLLLNATLTVRAHQAGSHQKVGWEVFTDQVIKYVSSKLEGVVFLLWGSYAIKKSALIDSKKHLILTSVHPSPLSAYRGFFGSKPFSQVNAYLIAQGKEPIKWQL